MFKTLSSKSPNSLNVQTNSVKLVRLIHYQTNTLPFMPVPNDLWFGIMNSVINIKGPNLNDSIYLTEVIYKSIPVPEVDELGTAFIREMLPVKYTIRLIDFLSNRAKMTSTSSETDSVKAGYSVEVMKLFQKESAGTASVEYEKQWSKAFSYYLENQVRKHELATEEYKLDLKYRELVAEVCYAEETKSKIPLQIKKVGMDNAVEFVREWNRLIKKDTLDKFFKEMDKMENK